MSGVRRALAWTVPATIALAAFVPPPPAYGIDRAPPEGVDRFAGTYRFDGGDRERRALDGAIRRVTDQMNVFIRDIAFGQAREALRPERRVALSPAGGDRVRIRLDDWTSPPMQASGQTRRVRGPDGDDTRLGVRYAGGRLEVRATTSRGTTERWLSLDESGRYLFVQVRVSSERLPDSVRYTLTYRRLGR